MLKKITLLRDRVNSWASYPFSVPAIRGLKELSLRSRICFFAGENGTGKSTLLEAIAVHYGFGREGGTRSFSNDTTESNHSIDPLVRVLRLPFDRRTGAGYFLRAESFFNAVSYIDQIGMNEYYDGRSLHARSHGESFFTLLELKFQGNGLFLLDEPEAASLLSASWLFWYCSMTFSGGTKMHSSSFPLTRQFYSGIQARK